MIALDSREVDLIGKKLLQLRALLSVSTCEDFPTFNDKIQQSYLWACSDLATEIDQMMFPNSLETRGQL